MMQNPCVQIGKEIEESNELYRERLEREREYGDLYRAGDFDTLNSRLLFAQIVMELHDPYIWKGILAEVQEAR